MFFQAKWIAWTGTDVLSMMSSGVSQSMKQAILWATTLLAIAAAVPQMAIAEIRVERLCDRPLGE
jgi:hypothetical protein